VFDASAAPGGGLGVALTIAAAAHERQVDKAGHPYIAHPLRMVARALTEHQDPDVAIIAALHDVVEDSAISFDDLRMAGFSEQIVDAVEALTRREGEGYADFLQRVRQNTLAVVVKLLDVDDNSDLVRLGLIRDKATRLRLFKKYASAREILGAVHHGR
jgi:(p)ppGpp synthase/HD superfamily hydrolase